MSDVAVDCYSDYLVVAVLIVEVEYDDVTGPDCD